MNKVLKGFSEKKDGSMHLPLTNPRAENIAHRKEFFEALGLGGKQMAVANLVHGTKVAVINRHSAYISLETDALVTKDADIILTLTGADCFPVYFEEKQTGIIGLAHCGWRGTVAGVVKETVSEMKGLGSDVKDIHITFGPGICAQHFDIKKENEQLFTQWPFAVHKKENMACVDLQAILKHQLQEVGVEEKNIETTNLCTYCLKEKYFSYRRDKPEYMETQLAYIVQFSHRKF